MDSLTQALLGAAVAATVAPKKLRKRALLVGALLGTLPDLDVLFRYSSDVDNFTHHRGFSHSLFILPLVSLLLMPFLKRVFKTIVTLRLYLLIVLSLITHALLDSLTAYGTQLFYPLDFTPTYISSIFIIDPLYTIWLFVGVGTYLFFKNLKWVNSVGIVISTLYLGLGIYMQEAAKVHLVKIYPNTVKDKWFVGALTASPFCWRGVYVDGNYYLESALNVLSPSEMIESRYEILPSQKYPKSYSLNRLLWFNPDTVLRQKNEKIVSSDLRMGEFGNYFFEFIISPKKDSGKRVENYNFKNWDAQSSNNAFQNYKTQNKNLSMPKRKWQQFLSCLHGRY